LVIKGNLTADLVFYVENLLNEVYDAIIPLGQIRKNKAKTNLFVNNLGTNWGNSIQKEPLSFIRLLS